jgi:hypothetical protein
LGFRLQSVMKPGASGNTEIDFNRLIHDPATDWVAERIYRQADEKGWGAHRLARHFNADPAIPHLLKPFNHSSIGYILDNTLYKGELLWNENATGIVNDTRVLQANPEEEWLRVPDFCEPIVPAELWDRVQALRQRRRERLMAARKHQDTADGKEIVPPAPGLTLKYLLTGLVRCGHCGASMRPSPSKYTNPNTGAVWRRTYYVCPSYLVGSCPNGQYLREDTLREAVIARIRARLFPAPESGGCLPDWFPDLVNQVQLEMHRQVEEQPDEGAAWEKERNELEERVAGWSLSLANPRLDSQLRADIENQYGHTKVRIAQLQNLMSEHASKDERLHNILDPEQVVDRLRRLGDIMAGNNPTQGNIELSHHIDRINCFAEGKVVLRSTPLGIFDGAVQLLRRPQGSGDLQPGANGSLGPMAQVQPRRRAQLRVEEPVSDDDSGQSNLDIADPGRFTGLDASLFWEDVLEIPRSTSWAEAHAAEVARLRATKTMEQLAEHFDKTIPTIRSALRKAVEAGVVTADLPKKLPRRRWANDHAAEVAQLHQSGMSIAALAKHFSKSEPTIGVALRHAATLNGASTAPSTGKVEPQDGTDTVDGAGAAGGHE